MRKIPRDHSLESSLALMAKPYEFISERCEALGSDVFVTRLMLRKTICMRGAAAAALISDPNKFVRHGAAPLRVQKTLFGRGGVQTLDGAAHEHRKQMFMKLMTPVQIGHLMSITERVWREALPHWQAKGEIVLYDELHLLLTRAVCDWTGVPLPASQVRLRANQLTALFDDAGSVGPPHWRSRRARARSERWIAGLVEQLRAGKIAVPPAAALHHIAFHRDLSGNLLAPRVAAVEVLNLLRPTVAVSVYIVFMAHALHVHPECAERLHSADEQYATWFVQEVRRFYPFFPAVPAKVKEDFDWNGYHFPANTRVMLDLHGTNHDARTWRDPYEFRPERFASWDGSPFNFIPQGPGSHAQNHRCPGEWITIEMMKLAARFFLQEMRYTVPPQNLAIDRSRLPALPQSGMVLRLARG